ncbi:hypothetical protein QJQ45_003804 [Haematococcus lacustris]|nr:hypothetical protein QJQ45_003804 [Haematococcus lacustris]
MQLEEEAASMSQQEWGTRKQLVVFFGNAAIGTRGGWGAKAVLQACRKVVERLNSGKPTDRVPGKVVTVDEFRTSRVSSILNSPQPCEEELDSSKPTRLEGWKPKPGQVQDRLLRSAWSKRFEAPVRGLMWCPWLAQATPGDLGKWVDRGCNAALNLQRAGESRWRPLELCRWQHRGRLPAQGKEYPALGFKKLRERAPKAQAQQPVAQYGVAACLPATQQILAFAEKNSMRVMLGLWIGLDSKSNEEELAALPGLLSSYSGVIQSVAVGNEPVSFLGLEPSFVLPLVKRGRDLVKRVSSIPVTSVEIASVWDKVSEQGSYAAQLLPEIDFVGVNAHPYFEGLPATCQGLNITGCYDAATWAVQSNYRPSGFPSSAPLFMAAPSVAASAAMLASFVSQAAFAGISYYYFEPFDADWKRTYAPCSFCSPLDSCSNGQCTYEYNWGLMTADRVPKSGMPLSLLVPSSLQPAPSSSLPAAPPATLPSPTPAQSPPFQSAPAPASSASPTPSGYFIATQPPSDWQSASQACSRSGARLAAFSSDSDRAGVSALLGGGQGQAQSAWVQEDTVGGQCPLVTPSSSGASLNRANCFDPKRPAVCYAAPSSGSNDGSWLAQVPLFSPAATQPALDTAQPLTQPFQLPQFSSGNQMFQIPIPQVLAVSQPEATPAAQSQ